MTNLLDGRKTYIGLVVAFAGVVGIANFFGGQPEFNEFLNRLVEVLGLAFAAYGRYQTTK